MTDDMNNEYDVVVVGGGAAGLSGGLMLGRSRRSVLVIDSGAPRNAPAAGVHGYLTREGTPPAELLEIGRDEVRRYGVDLVDAEVVSVSGAVDAGFVVAVADGRTVKARRLLLTTGLIDELPDIPGLRERWGKDLLHCPYCHGWEVRDQAIGVLARNAWAVHQAQMFRQLSEDVTLFLNDALTLSDEDAVSLAARGIRVVEGAVAAVESSGDKLTGVRLADGTFVEREAVTVMPRFVARAGFLADLGLESQEHPMGVGEHIPADENGVTTVPGVWVAGNITNLMAQVSGAAAAGALAGAQINADLIAEEIRSAVAATAAATV
ncbi:UNVERIFIED_CONTAM: thioredoxin reductase [Williamsia faeni]